MWRSLADSWFGRVAAAFLYLAALIVGGVGAWIFLTRSEVTFENRSPDRVGAVFVNCEQVVDPPAREPGEKPTPPPAVKPIERNLGWLANDDLVTLEAKTDENNQGFLLIFDSSRSRQRKYEGRVGTAFEPETFEKTLTASGQPVASIGCIPPGLAAGELPVPTLQSHKGIDGVWSSALPDVAVFFARYIFLTLAAVVGFRRLARDGWPKLEEGAFIFAFLVFLGFQLISFEAALVGATTAIGAATATAFVCRQLIAKCGKGKKRARAST